ncbi:hypothetical protein [Bosea eneae]|uniref:hypothetical protein n=1 Tax=Bosea eneae TaxID=151454 RepID=UPI00366CD354
MIMLVFLPVGYAEAADRIVALVERGVLAVQSHWLSREACQSFIDRQPRLLHESYVPTAAFVRVAGDAGHAAPFPPASMLCGSGMPFTNAEGAPRVRASTHADCRRANGGARSLGAEHEEAADAA